MLSFSWGGACLRLHIVFQLREDKVEPEIHTLLYNLVAIQIRTSETVHTVRRYGTIGISGSFRSLFALSLICSMVGSDPRAEGGGDSECVHTRSMSDIMTPFTRVPTVVQANSDHDAMRRPSPKSKHCTKPVVKAGYHVGPKGAPIYLCLLVEVEAPGLDSRRHCCRISAMSPSPRPSAFPSPRSRRSPLSSRSLAAVARSMRRSKHQ